MTTTSIAANATAGIKTSLQQTQRAVNEIARAGTTNADAGDAELAENLVNIAQQKNAVAANARVLDAYSESIGTLIDTLA